MDEEINRMGSYLDLRMHMEDKKTMQLKVPTIFDTRSKMWRAFYKFESGKMIHGVGKTSLQLESNFNHFLAKYMEEGGWDDVIKSFKEME